LHKENERVYNKQKEANIDTIFFSPSKIQLLA